MRSRITSRGRRRQWALAAAVLVAVIATGCRYDPAAFPNNPALSQCDGVDATIGIGYYEPNDGPNGSTYSGTEDDDVVVITNGPVTISDNSGSDIYCVNATGMAWGSGDCGNGSGVNPPVAVCVSDTGFDDDSNADVFLGSPYNDSYVSYDGADTVVLGDGDDFALVSESATVDCGDGNDTVIYFINVPPDTTADCETVERFSI